MFGNKENKERPAAQSTSTSSNSIVEGTSITGTINAGSDIRIDGRLEGNLTCSGRMIIGPQGELEGEAHCTNAVIEGKFSGRLIVKDKLNVRGSAVVNAEVDTNELEVDSGAVFNGNCNMGGQKLKSLSDYNAGSIDTEPALANG